MGQKYRYIFVRDILPLPLVSAKKQTNAFAVFELAFVGQGSSNWSFFLDMKETHFQTLTRGFPFFLCTGIGRVQLALSALARNGRLGFIQPLGCVQRLIGRWCNQDTSAAVFGKETLCKGRGFFGDQVVVCVFNHFLDKFGYELYGCSDLSHVEAQIVDLRFVGVRKEEGAKLLMFNLLTNKL